MSAAIAADEPLRVAYLVNRYPMVGHSFIRREILALERRGLRVQRIALRGWTRRLAGADFELVLAGDGEMRAEVERLCAELDLTSASRLRRFAAASAAHAHAHGARP